jgi:peptidoglycan/LPS O-acetylase OafA/YrhL
MFEPFLTPELGMMRHLTDAVLAGLYLSDYSRAFWGVPDVLQHTWSLSVEQHFYLLWPVVILALDKARNPERLLALALVAAFAWKLASLAAGSFDEVYYRFDTRITGLMLGSLLALRLERPASDNVFTPLLSIYAVGLLLLLFATVIFGDKRGFLFGSTGAEISTAILIGALVRHRASAIVQRMLAHRAVVMLGKISYGMYLWHFPLALALHDGLPFVLAFPLVVTPSIILASISYFTVERFFTRSRWRWGDDLSRGGIAPMYIRQTHARPPRQAG